MKKFISCRLVGVGLIALLAVGCSTSAVIKYTSKNGGTLTVLQPKDVKFDSVSFNPETGAVTISNYSSQANVEAIKAQGDIIGNAIGAAVGSAVKAAKP